MAVNSESIPSKTNEQAVDAETKEDKTLTGFDKVDESVAPKQTSTGEHDDYPEITPSQAVNVEILLELVREDDVSDVSMDSQQMVAASGFCVDEEEEEDEKVECYKYT